MHVLESLQKLQGAANTDPKRLDARLESLQVAALEDSNQRFFAARLELVPLRARFLVGFQVVGCKPEALDTGNDLLINSAIGGLQVISDRSQTALGEVYALSPDRCFRVGLANERPRPADDDLLQEIEQA